jgi:hypothetical protein
MTLEGVVTRDNILLVEENNCTVAFYRNQDTITATSRRDGNIILGDETGRVASKVEFVQKLFLVYYESIKREPKIRCINECRCDERLQKKAAGQLAFFFLNFRQSCCDARKSWKQREWESYGAAALGSRAWW